VRCRSGYWLANGFNWWMGFCGGFLGIFLLHARRYAKITPRIPHPKIKGGTDTSPSPSQIPEGGKWGRGKGAIGRFLKHATAV